MIASSRHRAGAPLEITDLARRWLSGSAGVYFAPDVPPLKEAGARGAHGAYLSEHEPLLVLYDATLLGTCENGFAVTAERLCWKNLLDHPRQIAWSELEPEGVAALSLGRVELAGGSLTVSGEIASSVAHFFAEMARRSGSGPSGPYRARTHPGAAGSAALGAPESVARLAALARRRLGEVENLYYHPAIPPRKLRRARAAHAASLAPGEEVAVLYDDTLFGDAEEGFLITGRRFCWKNFSSEPASLSWDAVCPEIVTPIAHTIQLTGSAVFFTSQRMLSSRVAALLLALATEVRH